MHKRSKAGKPALNQVGRSAPAGGYACRRAQLLNELQDFVRYLQPKKIFPCDVPKDMKYEEVSLDWSLEAPTVRFSFGKCRIFFLVKYIDGALFGAKS